MHFRFQDKLLHLSPRHDRQKRLKMPSVIQKSSRKQTVEKEDVWEFKIDMYSSKSFDKG